MRSRPGRAGLTRAQYLLGTLLITVGGVVLVSGLAVVFAREGSSPDDSPTTTLRFSAAPTGLEVVSGGVEVREGHLVATDAEADVPAVALFEDRTAASRLLVTAVTPASGWGLVFRWREGDDHWFASTSEEGGPLELGVVEEGERRVLDTAPSPLEPGSEVDVRFDRNRADVRVDGILVASARGREVDGRRAGVTATAPGAAWDDLELGPRPTPVVRSEG